MKKLLILLAFLPVFAIGQITETNRDFQFNGSIAVNGSDTLLVDSITGTFNVNYKLIDVDFDITLDYLPLFKTECQIIIYADTMPIQQLGGIGQRNANDADTLYVQSNDTSIIRIGHYSTPTADANNFYNALTITGTMLDVCASGCTYSTWASAITAASIADTIIGYGELFQETPATDKELVLIGLWNTRIHPTTGRAWYQYGDKLTAHGISFVSPDNIGVRYSVNEVSYGLFKNCELEGTYNLLNSTDNNDSLSFVTCLISGYLYNFGKIYSENNTYKSRDYAFRFQGDLISRNDLINAQSTSALNFEVGNTDTIDILNSEIEGTFISTSTPSGSVLLNFEKTKITSPGNFFSNSTKGGIFNFTFDSCEFVRPIFSTTFAISRLGDGDITFRDCYSTNFDGNLVTATKDAATVTDYNFLVSGCSFQNVDTTQNIVANNYKFDCLNSTFLNQSFSVDHSDEARHIGVYNNTFNNTDSISYKFQNGFVNYVGNAVDADTSLFISFTNSLANDSSLNIENNNFDINTSRGITLISVSPSLYAYRFLNGVTIQGNKFRLPGYYGNNQDVHTMLIFKNSTTVKYNYFENGTLTTVAKNVDENPIDYEIYGNLYKDCKTGIYVRSFPHAKIYNNTFYNPNVQLEQAVFFDNNATGAYSDSCEFFNNIIDSPYGNYYYFGSTSDTIGFQSYNNVLYNSDSIYIAGSYTNYSTWTGLGYDANSFNTDPLLNANGVPQAGSDAIGNGYNLGSPYNIGLTPSATFPDPATTTQLALWSIGAYIVPLNRTVTSNLKIIRSGNLLIRY